MRQWIPGMARAAVLLTALTASGQGAAAQVIQGRVVLQGWEERVSAARVQLLGTDLRAITSTETDAGGRFTFTAVDTGTYYVQAAYGQHSSSVEGPITIPAGEGAASGLQLTLPSVLYQRALACLAETGVGLEARERGGRPATGVLAGVAYERSSSTPLPAARVTVEWTAEGGAAERRAVATDSRGRFVFCDVAASTALTVQVQTVGRLGGRQAGVLVRPGVVARLDFPVTVTANSGLRVLGATTAEQERPDALATLQGQLLDANTREPIGGADIAIESTEFDAITSDDGHFRITGVPPGHHVFQVTRLGYDWQSEPITVEAGATVVLELLAAPTAVALDAVVVRVSTPETRMARGATQAPRVMAGAQLRRAEERTATLVEVIRQLPSLQIREGRFEGETGIERGICIESSRALHRYAIPEQRTRLPWCEMIAVVIDGIPTVRGTEMLHAMRLRNVESVEFLPPTGALQYGERAALNGAILIWTRGRGPHRDPGRQPGGG